MKFRSFFRPLLLVLLVSFTVVAASRGSAAPGDIAGAELRVSPFERKAPEDARILGAQGGELIAVAGDSATLLSSSETLKWTDGDARILATASAAEGFFLVTPERVVRLGLSEEKRFEARELLPPPGAPLPPGATVVATVWNKKLFVADARGFHSLALGQPEATWEELPAPPLALAPGSALITQLDQLTLFTPSGTRAYVPRIGWREQALAPAPFDLTTATADRYGATHVFFVTESVVHAYHVPTDTWIEYPLPEPLVPGAAFAKGDDLLVLGRDGAISSVTAASLPTGYNWLDHSVVAAYLLGMVGMSLWFARRKQDSNDYFRGGNRIPWWVSGMSLFATFASAISLMAMPGKSFSGDWTYYTISIFALLVLPISLFVLTPLVRRLKIPTANAYLERRFGLVTRLIGSAIGVFTTSLARQGSVLVLPSIALSTVMGVPVETCIVVMGVVTLAYTFFGGLSAVVWTDTVQGFIMIGAVLGCLLLAWSRIDLSPGEAWRILQDGDKLMVFDWNTDLTYPTAWVFLITSVLSVLGGLGSQDYIQRVQCTPTLKEAQLAVTTQLLVAVPLNLLLFALGTVLFLFYQQHPASLSPVLKLDGIYPFFVAQQLPPGVSGIVVAALLAATMSTISSCNCSVSDIVTQDFYHRFKPAAADREILFFGRCATLASGALGIATALWMANATLGSMWDLAILVTNLISNGIVGLFTLGLLTKRAHQTGALIGVAAGMGVVIWLQNHSTITFWLFTTIGTLVTVGVGYLASLLLPGRQPDLAGLTFHTMPKGAAKEA